MRCCQTRGCTCIRAATSISCTTRPNSRPSSARSCANPGNVHERQQHLLKRIFVCLHFQENRVTDISSDKRVNAYARLIDDFVVMVRPLSGATALSEAMGAQFDRIQQEARELANQFTTA